MVTLAGLFYWRKMENEILAIDAKADTDRELLQQIGRWKTDSENQMRMQHQRWAKNTRLVKGIFESDEVTRSKVRNRSKLYWRKIWASNQRLLASMYQAYLKEPDCIKIEARLERNVARAKVLTEMVKYRRDVMYAKQGLFRKLMWSLLDIINLSDTIGKMRWVYTEDRDGPEFVTYPLDQAFPDPNATCKENMRYIIFENYLTMDEMKSNSYNNLHEVKPCSIVDNVLKQAREQNQGITRRSVSEDSNYYPSDGSGNRGGYKPGSRFKAWEVFEKRKGKIWYTVTNESTTILKGPEELPIDIYPVVMGSCLLLAHQFFSEGMPEPQEGPQESANATLNMRKDAVALTLAPHRIVARYAGADLQSLMNARVGGLTLIDDINGIKEEQLRDVTSKAYMEVESDDLMMQEMSGVTNQRLGLPGSPGEKATVANISYTESGTKLDLLVGTVGETFFKDFFFLLAYFIQKFETDEVVFNVANEKLLKENPGMDLIYDIDDFQEQFTIQVGAQTINKQLEIQQAYAAMDRATMANQVTTGLIQTGAVPPDKATVFDVALFMKDLLPKIGFKNVSDYVFTLKQPPMVPDGGMPQGIALPQGTGDINAGYTV